jgi:hypothetical protein
MRVDRIFHFFAFFCENMSILNIRYMRLAVKNAFWLPQKFPRANLSYSARGMTVPPALAVFAAFAALAVTALLSASCLPPHGFWNISNNESTITVPGPSSMADGDIWMGDAASEALANTT